MAELRIAEWTILIDWAVDFDRLRVAAMGGAVLLCTAAVGGLVYFQDSRFRAAESAPSEQFVGARLPRPRPHEPRFTGSIEPGSAERRRGGGSPQPEHRPESEARSIADSIQVLLDQEEIASERLAAAARQSVRLSNSEALRTCEESVKRGLPVPSSYTRSLPSTGIYRPSGGEAVVTFDFDALNGLGFPLAMQAECLLEERNIARLEVSPR